MTFLPIVQRELRVRARSAANYWGRFGVAAVGVLVCTPPLLWSGPFIQPADIGRSAFTGLIGAAFLLCSAACLITADAISSERREGTLGLLLLTRVTRLDVLLGKLASSSVASLAGLTAFLPVLALPLLTGGVTGGEALRKALVLFDTLFLALSVGLCASARGSERFRSARAAVLILGALVLGPALVGWLLPGTHGSLVSPLGALSKAADLAYKTAANPYWLSLGIVHILGWAFLGGAAGSMRKGTVQLTEVHESSAPVGQPKLTLVLAPDNPAEAIEPTGGTASQVKCRYCGRLNESEAVSCVDCGTVLRPQEPCITRSLDLASELKPLHWLLRRQRGLKPMLWLAAVLGFFQFAFFSMLPRFFVGGFGMLYFGMSSASGLAISVVTGSIFAYVASRFFVQARRTGELELLLTTPVGAKEIVSAQWDTLKRLLLGPVALMLIPGLLQGALFMLSFRFHQSELWQFYYTLSMLLRAVAVILNVNALCWLGLWFGSRAVGRGRVILWSVLLASGVPYIVSFAWSIFYQPLLTSLGFTAYSRISSSWMLGYLIPQLAGIVFYIWIIRMARVQLLRELAGAEPVRMRDVFSSLLPQVADGIRRARGWPGV